MKTLFIGHNTSYALFYKNIEDSLLLECKNCDCYHVYFRPSAYILSKFFFKKKTYSTFQSKFKTIKKETCNREILIDLKFYEHTEDRTKVLNSIYYEYKNFFDNLFKKIHFDIAVLPGEYRIFEQAAIHAIQDLDQNVKIVYFEAGPPGYIYLDQRGVNANVSFKETAKNDLQNNLKTNNNIKTKHFKSRYFSLALLAIDLLWMIAGSINNKSDDLKELWLALKNKYVNKKTMSFNLSQSFDQLPNDGVIVVFTAQVSSDVNNTHFGISQDELEKQLIAILKNNCDLTILWRDHPLENSVQLFKILSKKFPNRVIQRKNENLKDILGYAHGLITVNSNSGIEALQVGLPVLVLGKAYYEKVTGVFLDPEKFTSEISKKEYSKEQVITSVEAFIKNCFIPIDYRNNNFDNTEIVANILYNLHNGY